MAQWTNVGRRFNLVVMQSSCSTLGPVSAWMGDYLLADKLSRCVTSLPGQLILASHWPCVTDNSGLSTYELNGLRKGDEHWASRLHSFGVWPSFTLPFTMNHRCGIPTALCTAMSTHLKLHLWPVTLSDCGPREGCEAVPVSQNWDENGISKIHLWKYSTLY